MNLSDYKTTLKYPLLPRTITFLIKNNNVLLGYKKKGFGKGNYLGIGGKVEKDEKIKDAAIRETFEEIKVIVLKLQHIGVLNFYFPHIPDESWNQQVHVFITNKWKGQPEETDEIRPEWFVKNLIPYEKMWDDAKYWLPEILKGESVNAEFLFDRILKVVDYHIKVID